MVVILDLFFAFNWILKIIVKKVKFVLTFIFYWYRIGLINKTKNDKEWQNKKL